MATAAGMACGPMPERGRFDEGGKWIVHSSSLQDYTDVEDYEFDLCMVDMYGASCVPPSPRDHTPAAIPKTPLQANALPRPSPNGVELTGIFDEDREHESSSTAWTPLKTWTPTEPVSSTPTPSATTSTAAKAIINDGDNGTMDGTAAKSAFWNFSNKMRPMVLKANPDIKFYDIGRMLGDLWGKLSLEEKDAYALNDEEFSLASCTAPGLKTPAKSSTTQAKLDAAESQTTAPFSTTITGRRLFQPSKERPQWIRTFLGGDREVLGYRSRELSRLLEIQKHGGNFLNAATDDDARHRLACDSFASELPTGEGIGINYDFDGAPAHNPDYKCYYASDEPTYVLDIITGRSFCRPPDPNMIRRAVPPSSNPAFWRDWLDPLTQNEYLKSNFFCLIGQQLPFNLKKPEYKFWGWYMIDDPTDSVINDWDSDYFYEWLLKLKIFLKSTELRIQLAKVSRNGSAILIGPKGERIWREIVTPGEIKDSLRTEGFNGDMNGDISFEECCALADQIDAAEAKQKSYSMMIQKRALLRAIEDARKSIITRLDSIIRPYRDCINGGIFIPSRLDALDLAASGSISCRPRLWVPSSSFPPSIISPLNLASPIGGSWTESHGDQPPLFSGYRPSVLSLVNDQSALPSPKASSAGGIAQSKWKARRAKGKIAKELKKAKDYLRMLAAGGRSDFESDSPA